MSQDDRVPVGDLTPQELAFLLSTAEPRGYTPDDASAEPDRPPAGPAGASPSPQPSAQDEGEDSPADATR
jgi:hypothetical protein